MSEKMKKMYIKCIKNVYEKSSRVRNVWRKKRVGVNSKTGIKLPDPKISIGLLW